MFLNVERKFGIFAQYVPFRFFQTKHLAIAAVFRREPLSNIFWQRETRHVDGDGRAFNGRRRQFAAVRCR